MKKIILALLVSAGTLWLLWINSFFSLPDVRWLKTQNPKSTAFMKFYKGPHPLQYHWVPYTRISPSLKQAVVIAEDGNFFQHGGADWQAIWEAMKRNWEEREWKWGGSTITQQLAKNLYLSPSKNPFRKLKEIIIAWELEQALSKQRILEIYLNVVEWGPGIYGAEAASQYYFGIPASLLSPAQSAKLAAILPNPKQYSRNLNGPYIERRIVVILKRMGYL